MTLIKMNLGYNDGKLFLEPGQYYNVGPRLLEKLTKASNSVKVFSKPANVPQGRTATTVDDSVLDAQQEASDEETNRVDSDDEPLDLPDSKTAETGGEG